MRRSLTFLCALVTCATRLAAQTPAEPDVARCTALKTKPIAGVAITGAQWISAGSKPPAAGPAASAVTLPAFCRVDGMIDRRQGLDGQSYGIGFALALPADWNGRLLMQGGGGLNGTVAFPLGAQAAGETPALARRFAVVTTDTGHQSKTAFDAAFMRDQQAALDFAYVAIGRVALLAKDLIARYYARPADHAYFAGCSTGGREGMVMAQRYPLYFDGIVSGAPAMRTGHSNLALRTMVVTFNQIAPRDAAGQPLSGQAFSESDRKTVVDGLLAACDATDGLEDDQIFDTRGCRFDPATLVCAGAKADGCLSAAQAAAIKKAFAGPKDSTGRQVYPGFLYDTGIASSGRGIPGPLAPGAGPPVGERPSLAQDIDREARVAETDPLQLLTDTATWTNLNAFSGHGGKLLFYHGVSDPWFSALDTVDYYERLGTSGNTAPVSTWSRLFLSPGMGHCGGGQTALDRFDLLTAVVDWVENGIAPDAVRATSAALPGRSRPLCAYPQHAQYRGSGDPNDAANFVCRP